MKNNRLLASAALFRELYDNNKDIYDVISEFIRITITINGTRSFDVTKCGESLHRDFGFEIPDAVLNTCLKKRLQGTGELILQNGTYATTDKFNRNANFQNDFSTAKNEYDEIIKSLIHYVKTQSTSNFDIQDEEMLAYSFNDYLLNENTTGKYVDYIIHFVLKNQNDTAFKSKLNQIEEGLVLYEGIKYSADLSTLGRWNGDLVVYLDTELLFSATGLNGVLHKKIFDDFHSLVKEVNRAKNGGSISLKYFEETSAEIDKFFYAAEKIVEKHQVVDPSKTAMITIINGSTTKSDVVAKKAAFLSGLQTLKIELEESRNYYDKPQFNIESAETITLLINKFNHHTDSEIYSEVLKTFTKINYLRGGLNNLGIEHTKAIFMTESRLTQAIAFSDFIYKGKGEIPFATNLEFLTERLWFKLNKGFGKGINIPASFDVITRAKLVLSSQINNAIGKSYKELKDRHSKGEITTDEVAIMISTLRENASRPEDLTIAIIDNAIDFLNQDLIEKTLREKSILEKQSEEGAKAVEMLKHLEIKLHSEREVSEKQSKEAAKAVKMLKQIQHQQYKNELKPLKVSVTRNFYLLLCIIYLLAPSLIIFLAFHWYSTNDTNLSLLFGCVTVIGFLIQTHNHEKIRSFVWRRSIRCYKKKLSEFKDRY